MGRTPEGDAAWARLNKILDENGGKDTPEYRKAWREWEIAVGPAPRFPYTRGELT